MKKIIWTIVVILFITLVWFYWDKANKEGLVQDTPEQSLDKETQADSVDDIDAGLDDIDIDSDTTVDFEDVDSGINEI